MLTKYKIKLKITYFQNFGDLNSQILFWITQNFFLTVIVRGREVSSLMLACGCLSSCAHQRWAKSEKLTPDPAPKTKTPDPALNPIHLQILTPNPDPALCPSLPYFYISSIYIIQWIPNPDPVFPKNSNPDSNPNPKDVARLRLRAHLWCTCAQNVCPTVLVTRVCGVKKYCEFPYSSIVTANRSQTLFTFASLWYLQKIVSCPSFAKDRAAEHVDRAIIRIYQRVRWHDVDGKILSQIYLNRIRKNALFFSLNIHTHTHHTMRLR